MYLQFFWGVFFLFSLSLFPSEVSLYIWITCVLFLSRVCVSLSLPYSHFRIKIGSISSLLLSCHKIHANKKLYLSFALKNSSFRFKLERRKRSDLTMDATLGTENNPTGKTRSIVSRPFRSLFFFAAVRQVTASFAISLFLSLSLSTLSL